MKSSSKTILLAAALAGIAAVTVTSGCSKDEACDSCDKGSCKAQNSCKAKEACPAKQ